MASTSLYRFEKQQVASDLLLSGGAMRGGWFFVVGSLSTHRGPERVGDLLNGADGFFPFQHDDGTTGLYNRDHVVAVHLPPGLSEEQLDPDFSVALPREVRITLSTGTEIDGTVFVTGHHGHERLSDHLRRTKRFLYLVARDHTVIVNSSHIVGLVERAVR